MTLQKIGDVTRFMTSYVLEPVTADRLKSERDWRQMIGQMYWIQWHWRPLDDVDDISGSTAKKIDSLRCSSNNTFKRLNLTSYVTDVSMWRSTLERSEVGSWSRLEPTSSILSNTRYLGISTISVDGPDRAQVIARFTSTGTTRKWENVQWRLLPPAASTLSGVKSF